MPEEVSTDVKDTPAPEPSTGQTITPPHEAEAYTKWRLTGEVEKKPPKKETSAPSNKSAEGESETEEPEEKTAPDSEPGKKQEYRKGSAESRLNQILADLKRAGLSPSELKTFKREVAQAQPVPQPPAQQTSVNPPPGASTIQQLPQRPQEAPKLENFKTWEEFNAAQAQFNGQQFDRRIQEALWQYQQQQQADARIAAAKQSYGTEAEATIRGAARTFFGDQSIHPAIRDVVNGSPVIEHLLYVMGSDPAELEQFVQTARTNPGEALRRAVILEQYVKDELGKRNGHAKGAEATEAPERDESGRFLPAKKSLPAPATEVSGRASPPGNEMDAAFHRGDVRAYMNAANRRDIAARKGR